jgi:hypothetical protein
MQETMIVSTNFFNVVLSFCLRENLYFLFYQGFRYLLCHKYFVYMVLSLNVK